MYKNIIIYTYNQLNFIIINYIYDIKLFVLINKTEFKNSLVKILLLSRLKSSDTLWYKKGRKNYIKTKDYLRAQLNRNAEYKCKRYGKGILVESKDNIVSRTLLRQAHWSESNYTKNSRNTGGL